MNLLLYKALYHITDLIWTFWHCHSRKFFSNLWVKLGKADRCYNAELPAYIPCCNANKRKGNWQTNFCAHIEGIKYDADNIVENLTTNPNYKIKIDQNMWWIYPFMKKRF